MGGVNRDGEFTVVDDSMTIELPTILPTEVASVTWTAGQEPLVPASKTVGTLVPGSELRDHCPHSMPESPTSRPRKTLTSN